MLAHCNLEQNMCLCSKQYGLFSFYALPSGGKLLDKSAPNNYFGASQCDQMLT